LGCKIAGCDEKEEKRKQTPTGLGERREANPKELHPAGIQNRRKKELSGSATSGKKHLNAFLGRGRTTGKEESPEA